MSTPKKLKKAADCSFISFAATSSLYRDQIDFFISVEPKKLIWK